jgi:UDP-glucose 4-epimerase
VYVGDVVRANLAGLEGGSGEIYVIGTGIKTSVNQIYKTLCDVTGIKPAITRAERRAGDAREVYFKPAKALKELGWKAETDLKTGMRATVDFFRDRAPSMTA